MAAEKKNYDSDFCGSLPLNVTNLIQPHGALLVIHAPDMKIVQASENIQQFVNLDVMDVLDQNLAWYIEPHVLEALKKHSDTGSATRFAIPLQFRYDGSSKPMLALVHRKNEHLLMELEPLPDDTVFQSQLNMHSDLQLSIADLERAESVQGVCDEAVLALRRMSGFNRIMIYRFDDEWNGTVLSEAKDDPAIESYLGLTFPASDIPRQARELYYRNPYRLIPDRNYVPVRMYPVINPQSNTFTDLSDCSLRSVAGVHLEYLKNMNVVASMSTRIIVNGRLWGLIACHHMTPKPVPFSLCSIFELMSNMLSFRIDALSSRDTYRNTAELQDIELKLTEQVYRSGIVNGLLHDSTNVMSLLKSDGAAVIKDKRIETLGDTPSKSEIKDLLLWINSRTFDTVYQTEALPDNFDNAADYSDKASGIIVLAIDRERSEYVIGFRKEMNKEIRWGGNPNEAIRFEENQKNYHPRNSFKIWKENVQHTSLPWEPFQMKVAENLRNTLVKYNTEFVRANGHS